MSVKTNRRSAIGLAVAAAIAASLFNLRSTAAPAATASPAATAAAYDPAPNAEVDGLKAKFIDVGGQRTRYYEYGTGEPVVLIHGGGRGTTSSANNFSPIIPMLAKHYHVIAFDKSAAGMTDNPKDDAVLSYAGEVKHAYNLIKTLKLGPANIVGHSSGGAVALYLAVEHPEVVKTLTIIAHGPEMPPLANKTKHDVAEKEQCKQSQATYEGRACRLKLLGHTEQTWDEPSLKADAWMADRPKSKIAREKYAGTRAAALPDGDLTKQYRQHAWDTIRSKGLPMPVMMLSGAQDTLAWEVTDPYAMMRSELGLYNILGSHKGHVKFVMINEAGHFPYREHAKLCAAEIEDFIRYSTGH